MKAVGIGIIAVRSNNQNASRMDVPNMENNESPKTPHEEIMLCIESTNDIVSKILEILEKPKCPMPIVTMNIDPLKIMGYYKKKEKKE